MKLLSSILFITCISCVNLSHAAKDYSNIGNTDIDFQVTKLAATIRKDSPYPLKDNYNDCFDENDEDICLVSILANGGFHNSGNDGEHFTVRFHGTNAPYEACHFYPDANRSKLEGVRCYNSNHDQALYCSYTKRKCD